MPDSGSGRGGVARGRVDAGPRHARTAPSSQSLLEVFKANLKYRCLEVIFDQTVFQVDPSSELLNQNQLEIPFGAI